MGNVFGSADDPAAKHTCEVARASHSFPLRISSESAQAAAAAALGSATPALVTGHTTRMTQEAGARSVRLQLKPSLGSASSQQVPTQPSCATVSIRSQGKLGFLPGIAAILRPDNITTLLEVIVFARPNELLQELMHLDEDLLKALYPEGSTVDVRILRQMPFAHFEDSGAAETAASSSSSNREEGVEEWRRHAAAESGDAANAAFGQAREGEPIEEEDDSAEAVPSEAAPTRSAKAEWLSELLLQQASALESQFGAPRQEPGTEASYDGCELDAEGVQSWLFDAGLRIVGSREPNNARTSSTAF